MMRLSRKIGINLILAMLSIENIMFLNYKIIGLDIVDIGVLIGFGFVFWSTLTKSKYSIRFSKYILFTVIFALLICFISFGKEYQIRYILPDLRNFLFMAFSYEIFRDEETEVQYVLSVIPFWGLINSIISLATFGFFSNSYTREIYTPLWISVFSIGCIITSKERKNPIIDYVIVAINIIAIILSQTRSYIIPVFIIFALYALNAIKNRNIIHIIVTCLVLYGCFLFFQDNGYYDMIVKRLSGSFDTKSTMWLRVENAIDHIKSMNLLDWIIGRGFGERFQVIQYDRSLRTTSDLEMFIPNQLTEWGLVAFISIYYFYIKNILRSGLREKSFTLILSAAVILIGGFVSGLVGMIGSVILGILFGLISNNTGNRHMIME